MGTRLAVSIALLGAALVLPAAAQTGSPNSGAPGRTFQMLYVLDMAGKTGLLEGVTGLPAVAPSASGAVPKAAPKTPMGPATLTLLAGHGLPAAFYSWVGGTIDGKPARTTLGIRGTDTTARFSQQAMMSDASVAEVGFPALDMSSNAALAMNVRAHGVLRIEPVSKPFSPQQMSQLAQRMASVRWVVSGYRLAVGKLDTSHVSRIEAFTLTPGGALQLQLTANETTTRALESVAARPVLKGQKPLPPPALDAQLQLLSTSNQVLATILLHEAEVVKVARAPANSQSGGAGTIGHVVLSAKQARITFAPGIAQ